MIKKIKSIRNFRNFLDFNSDVTELERKEVIFAQNGSGKTNLSRLINAVSEKAEITHFLSQEAFEWTLPSFEIKLSDWTSVRNDNYKALPIENIVVFNSDYVEKNVRCDDFSDKDISGEVEFPVWEADIEVVRVEAEIRRKEKSRLDAVQLLQKNMGIQESRIKGDTSKPYTQSDRSIWNEFKFENLVDPTFSVSAPVFDPQFDSCEADFLALSKLDESARIPKRISEIRFERELFLKIEWWLKKGRAFPVFDAETKDKIEFITSDWLSELNLLENGVRKSQESGKCLLCDRFLDSSARDLFQKYQDYFSNEESKFKSAIDALVVRLNEIRRQLASVNNDEEMKVSEYCGLFAIEKDWLVMDSGGIIESIDQTIQILHLKKSKPSEEFDFSAEELLKRMDDLNARIRSNLELTDLVNRKIENAGGRKTDLRKLIGKKLLYQFYLGSKSDFERISTESSELVSLRRELNVKKGALPKKDVSENIAELFDIFAHEYLRLDKYSAKVKDGKIMLMLNKKDISENTQKVSEWEKTMIWLCYFLASSIQKFNSSEKLMNSVFVIDDPVSSTSYGFFFWICNLLKYFEYAISKKIWGLEQAVVDRYNTQKIILTHNTQLFNMLRVHVFRKKAKYHLLNGDWFEEIPEKELVSEFELSISNIRKAHDDSSYRNGLGNDLRRFFETIRHFYGYEDDFSADTLKKVFPGFEHNRHSEFYSVVNYYSHGNPEVFTDPLPIDFKPFIRQFGDLIKDSQFVGLWNRV